MRSVNKVILIGNLTRDPEMRQTPNGQIVTTFGLATNREWMTRDHQKHNLAEFHDLVAWAKLAEICHKFLKKGKLIYIEGYLKTRSWDTPEGVKKFKTEIVVQDMIMLEKRSAQDEGEYVPEEDNGSSGLTMNIEDEPLEKPKPVVAPKKFERHSPMPKENVPAKDETSPKKEPKVSIDINDDLGL